MSSPLITRVLSVAKRYGRTPSELLSIDDEYTAYCLDEACAYIMGRLDKGDEMVFHRHYNSFSEIYSQFEEVRNID